MNEETPYVFAGLLMFALGLAFGLYAGWDSAIDSARHSAVEAGVGEYVADQESGETGFQWKRELVKP